MDGEIWDQSQSLTGHGSESKVLLGTKRGIIELEETTASSEKRMKIRDLESVLRSEAQAVIGGSKTAPPDTYSNSGPLDLNIDVHTVNCTIEDKNPARVNESNNLPTPGNANDGRKKSKPLNLDLNAKDISSSIKKTRDDPECGSSVGPSEENDSMRAWKGLKQNNYISTLHGFAPKSVPKPRGRKKVNNNEVMKKKIELAKKEQVDRFARIAAPSGLLNGLNPGIINHVRNSKQVHSIIEALVRSEKNENRVSGSKKCSQGVNILGRGDGATGRRQITDNNGLFSKTGFANNEIDGDSYGNEDDKLGVKIWSSSMTVRSENNSCLLNDESGNPSSVNSLPVKAANVASQWLCLLSQDIKGRLTALRRSKNRVRAVITTELPLLVSKEFCLNPENNSCETVDAHSLRWRSLFAQMDEALSEEESQLESWLNQVKEMQMHCDKGLCANSIDHVAQKTVPIGNDGRLSGSQEDKLEKDLAVRAAAASIYSTCNFLLSIEN